MSQSVLRGSWPIFVIMFVYLLNAPLIQWTLNEQLFKCGAFWGGDGMAYMAALVSS